MRRVGEDEPADVYVVNSCTVTHVADRKARQSVRAARRRNREATIVATGCYAERSPEQLRELEEVDLLFGNVQKSLLVRQVLEWRGSLAVPCTTGEQTDFTVPSVERTRAMVKIQEGCNQVCAYCIVPRVRGRERSIPTDSLVAEIQSLEARGYQEAVLTGTQLGSYGFDLEGASLKSLIENILQGTTIKRLRVSSLQPREVNDDLLSLWKDERLCPHFHLPLQSGSDRILRRMRRRYTAAEYVEVVERVRKEVSAVSVTADIIVGFPGESDADFQASYDLCESIGFADLHVFPYSVRPGTSAAHFEEQITPQVKKSRMDRLLDLARSQSHEFRCSLLGTVRPVLWEGQFEFEGQAEWVGLTDNYVRVRTKSYRPLANEITQAALEDFDGGEAVRVAVMPRTDARRRDAV